MWEEEFDRKFVGITEGNKRVWWVDEPDRVKSFISKAISQEKEKWAEQTRLLLKDDISHEWEKGWNKALLYFKDLLQNR